VNKYLHTVASVGFLFTLNYDARDNELKKTVNILDENMKLLDQVTNLESSMQSVSNP